jgi:hypothetical protein
MSQRAYLVKHTVYERLKAFIKVRHPRWPSQNLEQHVAGLHSPEWAEWYRNIFREDETKPTPGRRPHVKHQ